MAHEISVEDFERMTDEEFIMKISPHVILEIADQVEDIGENEEYTELQLQYWPTKRSETRRGPMSRPAPWKAHPNMILHRTPSGVIIMTSKHTPLLFLQAYDFETECIHNGNDEDMFLGVEGFKLFINARTQLWSNCADKQDIDEHKREISVDGLRFLDIMRMSLTWDARPVLLENMLKLAASNNLVGATDDMPWSRRLELAVYHIAFIKNKRNRGLSTKQFLKTGADLLATYHDSVYPDHSLFYRLDHNQAESASRLTKNSGSVLDWSNGRLVPYKKEAHDKRRLKVLCAVAKLCGEASANIGKCEGSSATITSRIMSYFGDVNACEHMAKLEILSDNSLAGRKRSADEM